MSGYLVPRHPTMTNFVDCVKHITHDYVCLMEATRIGLGRRMAKRAPVNIPKIPADFKSFMKKQSQLDLDT